MERKWYIANESHERDGYICLAIREEESNRLICDMSDYPDDVPGFVERVKEEARLIAHAKELFDTVQELLEVAQDRSGERYRDAIRNAHDLITKVKQAE